MATGISCGGGAAGSCVGDGGGPIGSCARALGGVGEDLVAGVGAAAIDGALLLMEVGLRHVLVMDVWLWRSPVSVLSVVAVVVPNEANVPVLAS